MTRIAIVDDYQNIALTLADWKSIPDAEFTVFDKPFASEDEIVEKLRNQGNEVWYGLFADEGHGFQKKPNNDLRREVETLFLQKLFGKE